MRQCYKVKLQCKQTELLIFNVLWKVLLKAHLTNLKEPLRHDFFPVCAGIVPEQVLKLSSPSSKFYLSIDFLLSFVQVDHERNGLSKCSALKKCVLETQVAWN